LVFQVHRARDRQGGALILKIQYPGIRSICDADLRQLRRLMPLGRLFGTPPARLEAVYAELQRAIDEELDYDRERCHLEAFGRHFESWPDVRMPFAVAELCRPGVLALEELPGRSFADVEQAPAELRQRLAETLCRWLAEQAFGLRRLHTDPHPGNLAWREAGELLVYAACCVSSRACWRVMFGSSRPCAGRRARHWKRAFSCSAAASPVVRRRTGCIAAST